MGLPADFHKIHVRLCESCHLCGVALVNWRPYILNAFDIRLSNGFTEGCNNAIKTLKRLAFGFRNFTAFRARILLAARPHPYI